jgi:glutamyl-tRNA synthetase
VIDEASWTKAMTQPWSAKLLDGVIDAYGAAPWEAEELNEQWKTVAEALDVKLRLAQGPVRVPVTGKLVGPPLFESLVELGREETLRRLTRARARLAG